MTLRDAGQHDILARHTSVWRQLADDSSHLEAEIGALFPTLESFVWDNVK